MKKKPLKLVFNKENHIVTLDANWYNVYANKKPLKIQQLELKLNKLMAKQGQCGQDLKNLKLLKNKKLSEIQQLMPLAHDQGEAQAIKHMSQNERIVKEINKKMASLEEQLTRLPGEIETVNEQLLGISLNDAYQELMAIKNRKRNLDHEIKALHETLKEKAGLQSEMDESINKLYTFIHDVAGVELMEQLDAYYEKGDTTS